MDWHARRAGKLPCITTTPETLTTSEIDSQTDNMLTEEAPDVETEKQAEGEDSQADGNMAMISIGVGVIFALAFGSAVRFLIPCWVYKFCQKSLAKKEKMKEEEDAKVGEEPGGLATV